MSSSSGNEELNQYSSGDIDEFYEISKENKESIDDSDDNSINMFGALMNILNGVLGSGILTISNSMQYCGVVLSIILMIFVCFLSYSATIIILKLQEKTGAKSLDEMTKILCGNVFGNIMTCLILAFCITAQISYLIIGTDMIRTLLSLVNIEVKNGLQRMILVFLYSLLIPVMLTIPRKVSFLSYFSFATAICVVFFFIVMIIKSFNEFPRNGVAKDIKYFTFGINSFKAISLYSMTFALPIIILPLILPYKKTLSKRLNVILLGLSLCFVLVVVPGLLGYLIYGQNAKDDILLSFDKSDYLIIGVKIGFLFVVTFSYPCVSISVMPTWSFLLFKESNQSEISTKKRIISLLISNSIPVIIAIFLPNILPALSIGGGPGCFVDFFFPPFMLLMASKHKWYRSKNILFVAFAILGGFLGIISTYCGISEAISSFRKNIN